ncbi:MAG: Fe(3+) dicitrate transport protein FecA [Planctomycetes bacterium]|nr:Fe(3+) dicitrate transport protein FecA [Planctomycetota bacterium]
MQRTRSNRRMLAAALTTVAGVAAATSARAEETKPDTPSKPKSALEEAADLLVEQDEAKSYVGSGEIVVTAASGGVPLMYAGARDVIDAESVAQYQGGNLSDVIRRVPGMYVTQATGNEAYLNVGSRGLSPQRGRYVGWLVDGLPISMAPYGLNDKDLFPVSMERIGTIDSIRGGAALRFGSHSVGGVVNLISRPIPETPTASTRVKFGSDGYRAVVLDAGGTWGPVGVSLVQVDKRGDGHRDGGEFDIGDFYGRVRWQADADDAVLFTVGRYLIDASLPGGEPQADYDRDRESTVRPLDDSHGDRTMYAGTWTHDFGRSSRFDLTMMWSDVTSEVRISRPGSPPFSGLESKPTYAQTFWGQARYSWDTTIAGMTHRFSHIVQTTHEDAENDWVRVPLAAGAGPATQTQHATFDGRGVALFNEDTIDLVENVQATLGYRLESIQMSSTNRIPGGPEGRVEDYTVRLPATSIAWTCLPRTALFVGRQKSFRTPYYDNFDPAANAGNEVQPEFATSREIGMRTRGHWGFSASATAFRNVFTDQAIAVTGAGGVTVFQNAGRTVNDGIECELSYDFAAMSEDFRGLTAYVTATNQESVFETGPFKGNDTPYSPRRLRSWGVSYEASNGFWARADGSSAGSSFAQQENFTKPNSTGTEGMNPAYTLWDVSIGWHEKEDGTGFQISAGITNVFDEEYFFRNSQGIWGAPGRAYYVSAGYTMRW